MLLSNCPSPVEAQSESLERQGGSGEGPGEQTNMGSKSIEGAWLVVVEIPVANLSFTAITTFAAGGVSSSTGAFDRLAQISPLYGTWKRTDRNRFDRTVYFFQFDSVGNPLRMLKNREVYRLKAQNELECDGRQYACDLNGQNCVDQNTPFTCKGRHISADE
jgi:hypothetical protein